MFLKCKLLKTMVSYFYTVLNNYLYSSLTDCNVMPNIKMRLNCNDKHCKHKKINNPGNKRRLALNFDLKLS